jgi:geranylgeranyl reductase family protein
MIDKSYDVIVVGGGPAGGTVAYELARRGIQVLVLEKEQLPRYKVCAGGLTLKTVELLDFDLSSVFEQEIVRGRCTYQGRSAVTMDFGEVVGWTVMRDKLDHLILKRASEAGAQVLDEHRVSEVEFLADSVEVSASGRRYACSTLIGADGANGIVARSAGLQKRRNLGVALEAEIPASADTLESWHRCVQFDFGCVPSGYGWVFPKKDVLSVGVATFWGKATNLRSSLRSFFKMLGLASEPQGARLRGHLLPLGGRKRILHHGRVLLTGDAAGLAEPLTGEGIYYAVKSAKIAAHTVQQALNGDRPDLSSYTERINAQIAHDLKYAGRLARLLYRFPRPCFHFFVRSPAVQRAVTNTILGRSTFRTLHAELVKTSPRILLSALR